MVNPLILPEVFPQHPIIVPRFQHEQFRRERPLEITPDCVLALDFNEERGNRVLDKSGYRNHGIVYGARWCRSLNEEMGSALRFAPLDTWVEVPHSASLNLSAAWTIIANIRTYTAGDEGYILAKGNPSVAAGGYNLFWRGWARRLETWLNVVAVQSDAVISWPMARVGVCVGITKIGTNVVFYRNGEPIGTRVQAATPLNNDNLYIATRLGGTLTGHFIEGLLDNIRVYNRGLTALEHRKICNMYD